MPLILVNGNSMKYLTALVLATTAISPAFAGDIHMEKQADGIWIMEDDRKVFFYRTDGTTGPLKVKGRAHYIHPLLAPDGKTVLTEDSPQDHIHQRGVFWAWHEIAVQGAKVADGWEVNDINWDVTSLSFDDETDMLDITVNWLTGTPQDVTITEQTRIHIAPTIHGVQKIEFDIKLKAMVDGVSIAGADNSKGYSGFSARLINQADMLFSSAGQPVKPTKNALKAGDSITINWSSGDLPEVTMTCRVEGEVIDNWIVRNNLSMQNCAWPGREHYAMPKGEVTSLSASLTLSQK